jgi:hypothetical protein
MDARGSLAAACLVAGALCGCEAPTGSDPPLDPPETDEALDVAVDSVDVVHGALRITATMVDGAADVSVRLGGSCDHREVGGGMATPSTLVWTLSDSDVAASMKCGLNVRARAHDGGRRVNRVADLAVGVGMDPEPVEGTEERPTLQSFGMSDTAIDLVFGSTRSSARLTAGGSVLQAMPPGDGADPEASESTAHFAVAHLDFARAVLRGRPFSLDGASFDVSLSVGGTSLQVDDTPSETSEEVDVTQEDGVEFEP